MSSLYTIDDRITQIFENLEDGEITEDADVALEALAMARADKIDNIAWYIKTLANEVEGHKEIEAQQNKWRKQKEGRIEFLKIILSASLRGEKFVSLTNKISFRKSVSVFVADMDRLPSEFITEKVEQKPNKIALKAALDAGEIIDGVSKVETFNIQIK